MRRVIYSKYKKNYMVRLTYVFHSGLKLFYFIFHISLELNDKDFDCSEVDDVAWNG